MKVGDGAPTAKLNAAETVPAGETATFDSSASSDPDDDLLTRTWYVDGELRQGGGEIRSFAISGTGDHSVRVVVTDIEGKSDEDTITITAIGQPPTAGISLSTPSPLNSAPVEFTSTSTDAHGTIEEYEWYVDGVPAGSNKATLTHVFDLPGEYTVGLRVTDNDMMSATAKLVVSVGRSPVIDFDNSTSPSDSISPVPSERAKPRPMSPTPVVRLAGALTGNGARLRILSVHAPKGARVRVACRGGGCPARSAFDAAGRVRRLHRFERAYHAGVKLVVRVTKTRRIGTYVLFTIRKGKAPRRDQRCLWPGERAPRSCAA